MKWEGDVAPLADKASPAIKVRPPTGIGTSKDLQSACCRRDPNATTAGQRRRVHDWKRSSKTAGLQSSEECDFASRFLRFAAVWTPIAIAQGALGPPRFRAIGSSPMSPVSNVVARPTLFVDQFRADFPPNLRPTAFPVTMW